MTKNRFQKVTRIFVRLGIGWLILSTLGLILEGGELAIAPRLFWFLVIAGLALLNLFLLIKVVATLTVFVSDSSRTEKPNLKTRVFLWALLKFGCLGMLLYILGQADQAPVEALTLSLATLVVIPLGLGTWIYLRGN